MIMFEKIKSFFETKYRIIPVYTDSKRSNYQVQKRVFWWCWMPMQMQKIEKVRSEGDVVCESDAIFPSEEEAMCFIKYQKTKI